MAGIMQHYMYRTERDGSSTVAFICSTFVAGISLIPVYKRIPDYYIPQAMTIKEEKGFQEKIKAIQDTMFVIGSKWKIPVLLSIYSGARRFNDIAAAIPKITNQVLSKELKHLEENLLISRTVIDDYPVRIEYMLTDYCLSIDEIAVPMEKWGKNHSKKISGK